MSDDGMQGGEKNMLLVRLTKLPLISLEERLHKQKMYMMYVHPLNKLQLKKSYINVKSCAVENCDAG